MEIVDYGELLGVGPEVLGRFRNIRLYFMSPQWIGVGGHDQYLNYGDALQFGFREGTPPDSLKAILIWLVCPDLKGLLRSQGIPTKGFKAHLRSRTFLSDSLEGELGFSIPHVLGQLDILSWATEMLIALLPHVGDPNLLRVYRTLLTGIWKKKFGEGSSGSPDSEGSVKILRAMPIFVTPPRIETVILGGVGLSKSLITILRPTGDGPLPRYAEGFVSRAIAEAIDLDKSQSHRAAGLELVAAIIDCIDNAATGKDGMVYLCKMLMASGMSDKLFWLLARRDPRIAIQILSCFLEDAQNEVDYVNHICEGLLGAINQMWPQLNKSTRRRMVELIKLITDNSPETDLCGVFKARLSAIQGEIRSEGRLKEKRNLLNRRLLGI